MGWLADPPPPHVDRQTPVKTVPSRRTTYAGGNEQLPPQRADSFASKSLIAMFKSSVTTSNE